MASLFIHSRMFSFQKYVVKQAFPWGWPNGEIVIYLHQITIKSMLVRLSRSNNLALVGYDGTQLAYSWMAGSPIVDLPNALLPVLFSDALICSTCVLTIYAHACTPPELRAIPYNVYNIPLKIMLFNSVDTLSIHYFTLGGIEWQMHTSRVCGLLDLLHQFQIVTRYGWDYCRPVWC